MTLNKERKDESREMLVKAFYFSLGTYTDQEGNRHYPKGDEWRDKSIGDSYSHLKHELDEIKNNMTRNELGFLLHNSSDAVSLSLILLAKVMEKVDLFETK